MLIVPLGVQNWLENVTYQMCNMSYKQQASKLAGYVVVYDTVHGTEALLDKSPS